MVARFPVAWLVVAFLAACGGAGGGNDVVPDAGDVTEAGGGDVPDAAAETGDLSGLDASDPGADLHDDAAGTPDEAAEESPADLPGEETTPPDPAFRRLDLALPGDIRGMWPAADGSLWAVGSKGTVLRSEGSDFLPFWPVPPTDADLFGISGDGDTLYVVGAGGIVLRYAPVGGWVVLREADGADLYGVSAMSAIEAYAVGKGGRVLHLVGDEATAEATGITYDLHGVSASVAGGVRAVGAYGTLIERGQAAWVRSQISGPMTTLHAIWRAPDGRMAAVGSAGSVVLYNGLTWQMQVTNDPSDPLRDLYAVWGTASDDIMAVGRQGIVVRYDGDRWSVMTVAGPYNTQADLRAIGARAGEDGAPIPVAAGLASTALELDRQAWHDRSLGVTRELRGVAVAGDGTLVIVGEGGLVLRGAPERLGAVRLPVAGGFNAVSLPWAVGDGGAIADLSGAVATLVPSTAAEDLSDVFAGGDVAWIAGASGTVFRYAGGTLHTVATRPLPLRAVCAEDDRTWVAGDRGRLELDEGAGFRTLPTGTSSTLRDLLPLAGGGVVAAGDNGIVLECTPDGCTRVHEEPATFLYGLGGYAAAPFAVGWAGTVLRRGGDGAWVRLDPGTLRVFRAVAGAPDDSFAALVGADGTLLIHREPVEASE